MPWVWQEDPKSVNKYLADRMDPAGWIVALGDFLDEEISLVEVALLLKELQLTRYYQLLLSLREEFTRFMEFQRGEIIQQPHQSCPLCGRRCACGSEPVRVASTDAGVRHAKPGQQVRADGDDPVSHIRPGSQPGVEPVGVPDKGVGSVLPVQDEGEPQPG